MAKVISFTYKGTDYTLEYTRRTVVEMENRGFVVSDVSDKPMSSLPTLFAGAFLAHHRSVKRDVIDEIFKAMPKKEELIGKLAEMYSEPLETLLEEPEESANFEWGTNW